MDPTRPRHSRFGALILLFLGVVILLNNLGILPWSVWADLWRFWPILLIFAGLKQFVGDSTLFDLLAVMAGIILTLGLVGYLLFMFSPDFRLHWLTLLPPVLQHLVTR